jgi:glycosyltransferase 2 family protein
MKFIVGIVLSGAALTVMAVRIDWAGTVDTLGAADISFVAIGFALFNIGLLMRAWRWSLLVRIVIPSITMGACYNFFMIGNLANLLLPMRAGDFARSILMGRHYEVSGMGVLTTVAVERVLDLFIILGITAGLSLFMGLPSDLGSSAPLLAIIATAMVAGMWGLSQSSRMQKLLRATLARIPYAGHRLEEWVKNVVQALSVFRDAKSFGIVVLASTLVWLPSYFVIQSFLHATGLDLPATAPLVVLVVTALGLAVPTVPGNIGVAHALYAVAVIWYGVEENSAYAFAILLHAVPHLWMIMVGLVALWRQGLTVGQVKKLASRPQA